MSSQITRVWAREVLDSRGNPTVEAEISVGNLTVTSIAPSGASTGSHEALELRDGGPRYSGKGVLKVVRGIREVVAPALVGMDVTDLREVDRRLIELDGTANKSRLGANGTVAVSLAAARAGAEVKHVPLHDHLVPGSRVLPVPLMNIVNGGKHAGSNLRIQEFMIAPAGTPDFAEALRIGAEVYQVLKKELKAAYGVGAVNIGDEGGFAPPLDTTEQALEVIVKAIDDAGYAPGRDVYLAIDAAASEFFEDGRYLIDGRRLDPPELVDLYASLRSQFPLISLEDPVMEDDFDTMARMTTEMGDMLQLVGDDLFVTDPTRLRKGIELGAGNALLLKVNQIGTVSEAMDAARIASEAGYSVMVSHRSGESEDTSIADIAVALECGQIKTGAPARGERTAKYNRLLRIEEQLGSRASYGGRSSFKALR